MPPASSAPSSTLVYAPDFSDSIFVTPTYQHPYHLILN